MLFQLELLTIEKYKTCKYVVLEFVWIKPLRIHAYQILIFM
jgi:hypothetical protein